MENTLANSSGTVAPENQEKNKSTESQCPVAHGARRSYTNNDWWPNQLSLKVLHQHSPLSDPMGQEFNYGEEFKSLDLNACLLYTSRKRRSRNVGAGWFQSAEKWGFLAILLGKTN